jgi:4'-phosphopantetheinyl transferase
MTKQMMLQGEWNEVSVGPDIRVGFVAIADFIKANLINFPHERYQTLKNIAFKPDMFRYPFLSSVEFIALNHFKALKKQIEWLAGRFAVKKLVFSCCRSNDYSGITIDYEPEGAPYLPEYPDFPISISHSGGYAAVALSRDRFTKIGIDIEKINPAGIRHILKVAYTDREQAMLKQCSDAAIFEIWTAKEAYLKYIKKGFNENLRRVEVIHGRIYLRQIEQDVSLFSGRINTEYALSLVYSVCPKKACRILYSQIQ